MKKIVYLLSSVGVLALPLTASAVLDVAGDDRIGGLMSNILEFVNTYVIPFIIAIGFLVFVWGMFQYFIAGGANEEKKEKGKSLMIWATVGFVLIIVFWGIVNLLTGSTGLNTGTSDVAPNNVALP